MDAGAGVHGEYMLFDCAKHGRAAMAGSEPKDRTEVGIELHQAD